MNAISIKFGSGSVQLPRWILLALALGILPVEVGHGQVAITEVMSNAMESPVDQPPVGGDDYWELTNFGEEEVDLTPYWFKDQGGFSAAQNLVALWDTEVWGRPVIRPGESVMFVRTNGTALAAPDDFRRWWGEDRLSPRLKIIFYQGFGLNNVRDTLNLWKVSDDVPRLIQRIELFDSPLGRSLIYEPATGAFGPFSRPGVGGAFLAATTEDVGSPGTTSGRAPLTISVFPQDTSIDAGSSVTLRVKGTGMPPPTIQWFFEGQPIADAQGESYSLSAVSAAAAGRYSAELDNGLERITTPAAILTVNDRPSCARIVQPPKDVRVVEYHTAIFHVETRGYPLPTIRWEFQGREIVGETSNTLYVENVDETRAGRYTVVVSNALCTTNVSMHLILKTTPTFHFTEAMVTPTNKHALQHDSWWELTNMGTNTESLLGYRWDDNPAGLLEAPRIEEDVRLAPGESAIFVSGLSPDAFRRWWGEENLPEKLVILSFPGNSLSANGDVVKIWDDTALKDEEFLLVSPTIIGAEVGRSLWYDPVFNRKGTNSVEGERSAFRAVEGGDIGSPGWSSARARVVRPRLLNVQPGPDGVRIDWRSEPGARYELWRSRSLVASEWVRVGSWQAASDSLAASDATPVDGVRQFYRVVRLP